MFWGTSKEKRWVLAKYFDPGLIIFWLGSVWVRSTFSKFGKLSSKKPQKFCRVTKISSGQVKKIPGSEPGQPLIYCRWEVCSGLGGVIFLLLRSVRVRSAFSESGKLTSNFLSYRIKKISSGWVKKYPGQFRISPLFTESQKYPSVRSQPISS